MEKFLRTQEWVSALLYYHISVVKEQKVTGLIPQPVSAVKKTDAGGAVPSCVQIIHFQYWKISQAECSAVRVSHPVGAIIADCLQNTQDFNRNRTYITSEILRTSP